MVPTEGVEPTRPCGHWILSPARLPVPPRRQLDGAEYLQQSVAFVNWGVVRMRADPGGGTRRRCHRHAALYHPKHGPTKREEGSGRTSIQVGAQAATGPAFSHPRAWPAGVGDSARRALLPALRVARDTALSSRHVSDVQDPGRGGHVAHRRPVVRRASGGSGCRPKSCIGRMTRRIPARGLSSCGFFAGVARRVPST